MTTLMIRQDEHVGVQFKPGYATGLLCILLLLGSGPILSSPAKATGMTLPNLACATTSGRSGTVTVFVAGRTPMALALPIQRQGQMVRAFDVHLHAVWLPDPLRQAETIADDMQQSCFVVIGSDGNIVDVLNSPDAGQNTKILESLN